MTAATRVFGTLLLCSLCKKRNIALQAKDYTALIRVFCTFLHYRQFKKRRTPERAKNVYSYYKGLSHIIALQSFFVDYMGYKQSLL